MRMFEASIGTVVLRFYLMMFVVIGSLFAGVPWLAVLAMPIFLSAMLGISFKKEKTSDKKVSSYTKQVRVQKTEAQQAA